MSAEILIRWFREHRRRLPWRSEPRDPYLVLVSELMYARNVEEEAANQLITLRLRKPAGLE